MQSCTCAEIAISRAATPKSRKVTSRKPQTQGASSSLRCQMFVVSDVSCGVCLVGMPHFQVPQAFVHNPMNIQGSLPTINAQIEPPHPNALPLPDGKPVTMSTINTGAHNANLRFTAASLQRSNMLPGAQQHQKGLKLRQVQRSRARIAISPESLRFQKSVTKRQRPRNRHINNNDATPNGWCTSTEHVEFTPSLRLRLTRIGTRKYMLMGPPRYGMRRQDHVGSPRASSGSPAQHKQAAANDIRSRFVHHGAHYAMLVVPSSFPYICLFS